MTKETVNSMPVKYEFTSNDISDSCKNENVDEKFNNILEYLRKKNYDIINKSGISGVKESASLSDGNWFFAEKGKIRYWGSYLTHFGILLFITGYITGKVFGFLGTVYIYNDTDINYCYNWYEKKDKLFDFKVYLENLDIIFYPVKAKLEIISLNDNRRIIQNINENEKVYLEIGNYTVILEFSGFIPDAMVKDGMVYQISKVAANPCFIFKIYDKNKNFLFTHFLFLDKSYVNSLENLGFRLEVKKYKAVESEIKGDLIFLNNEQILKRETLKINKPVNFKGKNFYLVTYGQDEFKNTRIGLQITEDPGIYIIWSSFIFMLSGIIISFFIYHIKIYTYKDNNSIIIGGICGKSNYIVEKELKKIKKEIEND
ncbi:cytochrome c biogenesis protein ResB [Candidatus Desantisbacteria bacterium]|nr:cytochrome c biogenesis protein ResB [Candidatus Desantisbacteria bacterium]